MKRIRPFLFTVALGAGSIALLAGCSGKPENSPAIRKKFAEMETMKETVDELTTDVQTLTAEIARLREDNSELRAFLPSVDGTSAVERISRIDERLRLIENSGSARTTTPAAGNAPARPSERPAATQRADTATETALEDRTLAGAAAPVVAAQQSAPAPRPVTTRQETAPTRNFREMTNPSAGAAIAPRATTPAPAQRQESAPARAAAPANRGTYHTIVAGETLEAIAQRHNMSPDRLRQAIGLPQGAVLRPGQRIFIPAN